MRRKRLRELADEAQAMRAAPASMFRPPRSTKGEQLDVVTGTLGTNKLLVRLINEVSETNRLLAELVARPPSSTSERTGQ